MLRTQNQIAESGDLNIEVLRDAELRRNYSGTAIKAFIRIMETWDMSIMARCAILGDVPKQTYYKWARGDVGTLSRDQLERIGITLGIFKGLQLLFTDEGGRMRWFKSPNIDYAFKGKSPAERMTEGGITDMYAVRRYIDGLRGAH